MSLVSPFVCRPHFLRKPWGGRLLAELFNKPLPPDDPIGESWELVSLPEVESVIDRGPYAGQALDALVQGQGRELLGAAQLVDQRFPLLIKFLDARRHLSVQVHPKPDPGQTWQPGIKHEAWYVLHAEPGAQVFINFRPGVTPADAKAASGTPAFRELLAARPATVGDCFYLPSGTVHALGGGLVVAEVQTPSDVTYRLYDWDRMGLDGKPRALHIEQGLSNARYDVTEAEICQPRLNITSELGTGRRVAACHAFTMDHYQVNDRSSPSLEPGPMRIWIMLAGSGQSHIDDQSCDFNPGDTLVIPAAANPKLELSDSLELIEVRIPESP
jgi:mannose-6-phosphate isomerase